MIHGAEYYPETENPQNFDTEFHVICKDMVDEDGNVLVSGDKTEVEAKFVVNRIRRLMTDGFQVFDKVKNQMRPIEFRDIVILVRNTKSTAPVIEKIFDDNGMPVYTDVGHSYLGALEIQTVMAFLQIIDNPEQDIPLIATLRSPMWDFSAEELAEIRNGKKGGCFFEALENAAESGNSKAKYFVDELKKLRRMSEYSGVVELLCCIYYDFGYYAYVGSLNHGAERQGNLNVLLEQATSFEQTKLSGLFSFMNYIETMRAQGGDFVPAKPFGEGADVVRIMSIHKSKGLEFPVVFLLDTAHRFNMTDASKSVIWDGVGGIGAGFVDTQMRVKYPTLPQLFVGMKMKEDFLSEEMRLLYVALTRAQEKLIITSTFRADEKSWKSPVWDDNNCVSVPYVRGATSYREWLVAAFMRHPCAAVLRDYCGISDGVAVTKENFDMEVFVHESPTVFEQSCDAPMGAEAELCQLQEDAVDELKRKFDYVYPGQAFEKLPVKLSVSEVKRMQSDDEGFVPTLEVLKSDGLADSEGISGAEKGTVVHFVMQMLNPLEIDSEKDVEVAVLKMQNEKIIDESQAGVVDCSKIAEFFLSPVGQRLKSAPRRENEFSFYTKVPASEIFGEETEGEILLQGTMDCFFVEDSGRCVLIDFKTDRVISEASAKVASEKYRVQMKYYKQALKEILGTAVDECYLYFLECGAFVEMNDA